LINARSIALEVLELYDSGKGFVGDINKRLSGDLSREDAALSLELALGVVRNRTLIEYTLKKYVRKKPKTTVILALQIGVYQIGWMKHSGMPDHALIHPLVEIVKQKEDKHAVSFCNAVLRNCLRDGLNIPEGNGVKPLSIRYSHPQWLVKKWLQENGQHALIKRLEVQNKKAPHWLRLNKIKGASLEEFPSEIKKHLGVSYYDTFYRIESGMGELLRSQAFTDGRFSIQDPAAFLMYQLLGLKPGEVVFDACAAPGGKTALMLEQMHEKITVVSADLKVKRLGKLNDIRTRLGLHNFQPIAMDARHLPFKTSFEKILIDAPCSNLGVIARRPEAKWNVTQNDIESVSALQSEILDSCSTRCSVGGVMVYATCSPENEETNDVVAQFLETHPEFEIENAAEYVDECFVKDNAVKIIPGENDFDGFYGVRLKRLR